MSTVQPLNWALIPVSLRAQLYYSAQGGQSFSGIATYEHPEAPYGSRQFVLSGKFLDVTPSVLGDTVIELESFDSQMHISLLDPSFYYGELVIIGTRLQLIIYELPLPNEPDNRLVHAMIFGYIRPINDAFVIESVRTTQSLTVVKSPIS
ncbi:MULTISPECIES: hypothetical protein [unclassified Symbiopectobacterium]|uniref:hypothetical protein n=1 Tax=unclassified Symbiopectobacterium TaxID=2794573 RepID=UPI0022262F12|nr:MULTISPECIES: hypothetical protein [unclassified Symbiopectobacterium]MCW2473505.1 hypothetical protein [Candidatus Symbiopectobacterium sp. NZEC151]MCW2484606.1 hypothetical protein [Candidatus Symbiopectobacterium sp. NZEC127]